jgi:hypothetical protein
MADLNLTLSPLARLQGAADGLDTLQNEAHAHATRVSALLREASAAWEEDRRELTASCDQVLQLEMRLDTAREDIQNLTRENRGLRKWEGEYDRINEAVPGWAHDTSDVPLSDCVKAAFTTLKLQVERLTLERDEARRMTEERGYAFVHFPILCKWISALDPWAADERAEHHCHFCGVVRFVAGAGTLTENTHRPTCVWKFATDSIPPESPTPLAPVWWTRCSENGHEVTILEKDSGTSEFFCSDCSRGESSALRPTARITSFLGKTLERPIPLYGTNGDSE